MSRVCKNPCDSQQLDSAQISSVRQSTGCHFMPVVHMGRNVISVVICNETQLVDPASLPITCLRAPESGGMTRYSNTTLTCTVLPTRTGQAGVCTGDAGRAHSHRSRPCHHVTRADLSHNNEKWREITLILAVATLRIDKPATTLWSSLLPLLPQLF